MRWGEAHWLYVVALVVILAILSFTEIRSRIKRFAAAIDPSLWPRLVPGFRPSARFLKSTLFAGAIIFSLLSLARPQWGVEEETLQLTGMDIVFAVDVSNSMLVEDVPPNRLKQAQRALKGVVDRLGGDRVGIVAFAGSAHLVSPLTNDHGYVKEAIDSLDPQTISFQGTDIGMAIETAIQAIDRGSEAPEKGPAGTKAIVLVSDGEDLEDQAAEGAQKARAEGIKLLVLGVGTEKGGPVPVRDENGNLVGFKRDEKRQPVVSKFSGKALQEVARKSDGRYWTLGGAQDEVIEIARELSGYSRGELSEKKIVKPLERYQIPLAIAIFLLFIELGVPLIKSGSLAGLALFLISASTSSAGERAPPAPSLRVFEENKAALQSRKEGRFAEARRHFGAAQALAPDSPELRFNQGVVQAEGEELESALSGFKSAAELARRENKLSLAAKSRANEGLIQQKQGKRIEGIESLVDALEMAKASGDEKLADEIRKRLVQQASQQQQQNKNEGEQKEKNSDQSKGGSGDKPQDQSKDDKDREQKNQQFEDPSQSRKRMKFRSEKLSQEDAQKVMAELMSREKQLQKRLSRQKPKATDRGRDW